MADYKTQRRDRPRIEQVRWYCLPVYPYMDAQYFTAYWSLPLSHIQAERAPLALLCSYKTGLEKLPSAAYHFGMSISKEFRYRHILHWGRVVKKRYVQPLQHRWRESKGKRGFGRNALTARLETELPRLQDCQLFHWPAVQSLIERARSGAFINSHALEQLLTAAVIDDFLFGSGFSGELALRFLEPCREIWSCVNLNEDLRHKR